MINTTDKLLKAAHMIDGTGAPRRDDIAILIVDGKIAEIGPREAVVAPAWAEVVDLGSSTIMPGMIDAHMHLFGVPNEGHVPGPRLMAAGEFICSTDGTWDHIAVPLDWARSLDMIADGVEGVREIVRRRIRRGSNVIKVGLSKGAVDDKFHPWGDDPLNQIASYSLEEVKALVQESHLNKLKVSAHCIGDEAVRYALDGGVDVIEHGYGITEDTRKRLVDENALVVTTISQLYFHRLAYDDFHYPEYLRQIYDRHIRQMRIDFEKSLAAGVRFALGTDLVGFPTHPQNAGAREFEFAVEWGMDSMLAISAGTRMSAEAMGMERMIGTLEKGKLADIIAMAEDPLRDITELQRISFVMLGGNVIVDKTPRPTAQGRIQ